MGIRAGNGCVRVVATVLTALGLWSLPVTATFAQEQASADTTTTQSDAPQLLSEDQLEVLVARIALYPDELVALISSASIYPLQIVEASRYLDDVQKNKSLKPKSNWDGSVVSLLNYPDIVKMMANDLDWTQAIGAAIANQQKDVLVAIQTLRDKAVADGVIKTDDKIKVVKQNDNVVIQAANPEKIYVPHYPPEMLYQAGYPPAPLAYYPDPYPNYYYPTAPYFAAFVTGAVFGAAVDWDHWGVWGGRYNGNDVNIDCNNCFNNINGKVNFNDVDWKNVDRSKISFDQNQFTKLDNTNMRGKIEANDTNNVNAKAKTLQSNAASAASNRVSPSSIKDVRANKIDGGQPGSANRGGNGNLAGAGASRPDTSPKRPDAGAASSNRPAARPNMANRPDNRPSQPSGLGEVRSGRAAQMQSDRGGKAMGGGQHGGGRARIPHGERR
ncbi:DUF3300 domain-containing protein [Rhizobium sp. S96]|uniref:DUF3300 domain-containing protein n=1 Tax=Rhizobium sp. S96 TaxID=3055140 RepID=UPI0025AB0608|nr:DUF3300 domain-containing protein [Rhizobium sp. S96]MDM9620859.1 DUF3300 domain-containing protein [Rhizobium sp. S96]